MNIKQRGTFVIYQEYILFACHYVLMILIAITALNRGVIRFKL